MRAMVLEKVREPLSFKEVPKPIPKETEVLIKVLACGVCRTDQHIVDGEIPTKKLPLIPGHQIVGKTPEGKLVGVAWLAKSCGKCGYCKKNQENLCDHPLFTGYSVDGGFAEYCIADKHFIYELPKIEPVKLAPLLCAGMLGHRAIKMAGDAKKIGFYGFGTAAHINIQLAQGKEIFAFTRKGDKEAQALAKKLGAIWVGNSTEKAPLELDAAIIFASDGNLIPKALKDVKKGGIVITAGIHMSDIPSFPYSVLWGERTIKSVANLTHQDGLDFLKLIEKIPLDLTITTYSLEDTNKALDDLRSGKLTGAAVITL